MFNFNFPSFSFFLPLFSFIYFLFLLFSSIPIISFSNIDEDGMIDESDVTDFSTEKDEPETSLWVEKFNPKRFTELLSDDVSC